MLRIDQVEAWSLAGGVLKAWGLDNSQGWCISTQPEDGNAFICEPDLAAEYFEWVP